MGLLTRVGGETLRLFAELGVQVDLGVAAARSALDGLVAPLTLISHVAPFVLVGHAPSFPDSRCDRLAIDSAREAGGWAADRVEHPTLLVPGVEAPAGLYSVSNQVRLPKLALSEYAGLPNGRKGWR